MQRTMKIGLAAAAALMLASGAHANSSSGIAWSVQGGSGAVVQPWTPLQPPLTTKPNAQSIETKGRLHCDGDCGETFYANCDKNGGGLSTNPDGSETCTVYDYD
jgi:hypothetical protein